MDGPPLDWRGPIECGLELGKAGDWCFAIGGEDELPTALGQGREGCGGKGPNKVDLGLVASGGEGPALWAEFGPTHRRGFGSAGSGQKQETNKAAEDSGARPQGPEFVIGQDTLSGSLLRARSRHAPNDRGSEVIAPGRVPIENAPEIGEGVIGHSRAGCIFDGIEKPDDIRAADFPDGPVAKGREDQSLKGPLALWGCPDFGAGQPLLTDHAQCLNGLRARVFASFNLGAGFLRTGPSSG
jgi:hypothetical protein